MTALCALFNFLTRKFEVDNLDRILFINACVRENSRTLEITKYVVDKLCGEVCEINLKKENLKPLDGELLEIRERLVSENDFSDDIFKYAKEFAYADTIVIAAPYWDLTFPSLLKVYLENITVSGITFKYEKGIPKGLCKAKRLIYVTTSGGQIYFNFGFDYVKALAENFYGIKDILFFKAENLDVDGNDITEILQTAKREIDKYFKAGV